MIALILSLGAVSGAHFNPAVSIMEAAPAVTLARSASNTFAGIRPSDVPGFIAAQLVATATAVWLLRWMFSRRASASEKRAPATAERNAT